MCKNRSIKLHAVVDGLGNPVEFVHSTGNGHDSAHAVELLKKVELTGSNILADRAYEAQTIEKYISERGASYVVSQNCNPSGFCLSCCDCHFGHFTQLILFFKQFVNRNEVKY